MFYKQTTDYAIENWASYDTSETIVESNGFLSNDRIALRLPKGYKNAKMTVLNNYWNTEDASIIDEMVFDKNDDLGSAGIIETTAILLEPHENTPKVDFSELVIAASSPTNGEANISISKSIEIKFNKNVEAGEEFEEIVLTDSTGNNIEVVKSLGGNTLNIVPKSLLELGNSYYLNIPMNAIRDFYGNSLINDYTINFTTKNESFTTPIGGIISKDTTLTFENSPYSLTGDIQIAYGTSLNIEPGVIIKGNNYNIKTWGVLNAIGTEKEKIRFENVNIGLNGTSAENSFINIQFSEISGGSIISPGGNAEYGSIHILRTLRIIYMYGIQQQM